MTYLRQYVCIALWVLYPSITVSCELSDSSSSEDGTYILFDGDIRDKVYFSLKKAGENAEPGSLSVAVDSAFLTDHAFWKTMIPNLAEKGAKIDINCGSHACNTPAVKHLQKLSKTSPSMHVHQNSQHGKRVLINYIDDQTGEQKYNVFEGSHNLTHAARTRNCEIMSCTKNNKNYFKQVKESHDAQYDSPDEDKENKPLNTLKVTPTKKKHIDSNSYDLMDSVVRRIQNADTDDELYLASMNLSHPDLITAIKKACKRDVNVDIFVHNTALNSKTREDFETLKKAGAHIYVYPEEKDGIFHQKICLRVSKPNTKHEDSVLMIQSRNFTEDTENHEFNHQAIFPHDHNLSEQVKKHLRKLRKKGICKPLSNAMIQDALLKKKSPKSSLKKKKTNLKECSIKKTIIKKSANQSSIRRALFRELEDLKNV